MASVWTRGGGRATNLALLGLLPSALVSGAVAFALGSGWATWALAVHGVVAFAIVVLGPWKAGITRRGIRRRKAGRAWPSIALAVLAVVVLVTGIGHSTGLLRSVGSVTAMQIHVGAALGLIPFLLWHALARPVRPRRFDVSRRTILRSGALLAGSGLAYAGAGAIVRFGGLPGDARRYTGSYEAARFDPGSMPVTQWLDDRMPSIDPARWTLTVSRPGETRVWKLDELAAFDDRLQSTLDCTGGWYSTQEWSGVVLSRLLPDAASARCIEVASATGYGRRFPASDAPHLLLALRLGGQPLAPGHGFPARLVAPGRRGFWWVKWITRVETSDTPWWWQPPFPLS